MRTQQLRGQGGLETAILLTAVVVALVALSQYVRYAIGGRVRATAGSLSDILYNTGSSRTSWTMMDRETQDLTEIVGGVAEDPAVPGSGIAGVPVRKTTTIAGTTTRADTL